MSIFNQVRPPGDVLPDIIRSLASATNITNAGILYDNSFGQQRHCHFHPILSHYHFNISKFYHFPGFADRNNLFFFFSGVAQIQVLAAQHASQAHHQQGGDTNNDQESG